ncbi:glycosyltransferase [Mycobacterium sp. C3-094]
MKEIDWRTERFTSAMTTGAAVGLAGLGAARLHGIPSFYFESVSRVNGPSLTGRLVSLDPGVSRSCQYEHWARGGWTFRGSLFDSYVAVRRSPVETPRLFVTLGTIRPYRFDALVDAVLDTGLANSETVWQLGVTTRRDLPGTVATQLSHDEFERCVRGADVVVTHSGVGTLMDLLDMGVYPLVVPRRARRREHVDDHQVQVAGVLKNRGIAAVIEAEHLDRTSLLQASAFTVVRREPADQ